ncbi:MAG: PA2779 family protein [Deltaproteobacteria bacterium]|nr:PA2779 family protein [Deltaproteobacteria bacterium]
MSKTRKELTSLVVIFSFLCACLPTSPALAGWAPTRFVLEGPKARLVSALERQEVARALEPLGVHRAAAARRVAGLTDAEAEVALERLDAIPAGGSDAGDAIGAIVAAALLVFFVLLLTDLLGLTHFFSFTKRR